MCIRDSFDPACFIAPPGFLTLADLFDPGPRGEKSRALRRDCLLYTSDAADERSSVDLGGRRIIKKKKQQNHTRHEASTTQSVTALTSDKTIAN